MIEHSYICGMIPMNHWSRGVGNDIKKKKEKQLERVWSTIFYSWGRKGKKKSKIEWKPNLCLNPNTRFIIRWRKENENPLCKQEGGNIQVKLENLGTQNL